MQKLLDFVRLHQTYMLAIAVAVMFAGGIILVVSARNAPAPEIASKGATPAKTDTKKTAPDKPKQKDADKKASTKKPKNKPAPSGGTNQPPSPAPRPAPQPASHNCPDPVAAISGRNKMWFGGGYIVHNNMWNSSYSLGPQTTYICSPSNWYVVSNQTNEGGAVKTYPNVHKDYHKWGVDPNDGSQDPLINSFSRITSSFAYQSPGVGGYNVAYDIWLNGVASAGSTEVMIWTENHQPAYHTGNAGSITLDGHRYHIITRDNNHYIAIIAGQPVYSGTFNLLALLNELMDRGMIPSDSTLGQIDFGVEISYTGGQPATFTFTNFSISDTKK